MSTSNSDEDIDDNDRIVSSQSERDMYEWLKRKCGTLPRDDFKKHMSQFSVGDLSIYRTGLYMVCKEDVPHTPIGDLVVRKDTSHSNGQTDTEKLCDDIYNLYQYIEGDNTMDIKKMFTERSRKQCQSISRSAVSDSSNTGDRYDATLKDFCRDLLIEMRKDRDVLNETIVNVQRQLGAIPLLERDIRDLRSDIVGMSDRLARIESLNEHNVRIEGEIDKRVKKLEASEHMTSQAIKQVGEHVGDLRGMYASVTNRINMVDLVIKGHPRPIPKPVVNSAVVSPRATHTVMTGQSPVDTQHGQSTDGVTSNLDMDRDQTMVKVPISSTHQQRRVTTTAPTHVDTAGNPVGLQVPQVERSSYTQEHTIGTLSTANARSTTDRRSVSTLNDGFRVTINSETRPMDDDLQGYTQVTRPRYIPLFVSGVKMKNDDVDDTIQAMQNYIKKVNERIRIRSLKMVKQSGGYMSAKLVILAEHGDNVVDGNFWPIGIYCRKWIN